jgi:regulator of protease activity HflC (stomatin/prohibitin superfamily)
MITLTLIFLTTVFSVLFGFRNYNELRSKTEPNRYGDIKVPTTWLVKPVTIFLVGLIVSLIQPFSLERVDAGYKGIKVKLAGQERGVSNYQYRTGWVIYNTWIEQLLEFPTYQQHIDYDEQNVITKGGFSATIKPSFNYSLKPNEIVDMFVNLRLGIRDVEQGWLKNAIISSVNDVANKWEVDAIFNEREKFESAIVAECNKRVQKWFIVSQLRTNIIPPQSLQAAIESKTKAVQEAQAAMQRKLVAEAKAQEKIAIAKGDSAKLIIGATAEALAMRIKQKELTPEYIEFIKTTRWNGVLPTTTVGSSTGTLLNIR